MVTTRAQKALTPKRMFARKVAAKKIQRRFRAGKGLVPRFQRGKKSYKPGNVVREVSIGKTPWVGKIGFPYRKYFEHKSNTGDFKYGPSGNVRRRATKTRLVSRRCRSKKECKAWAGEWDGKRTYKKYSREKFYPQAAALARRQNYNKAEPQGLGFIISYRKALARRKRQLADRRQQAARNAAVVAKRKRANVNQSAILSGKRRRVQPQRFA